MKDLQQPQIISYGSKGNRSRYSLESPPPAAHISYKPEMVGKQYGWVKIISAEKRWRLIATRLDFMTYKMPEDIIVLPYRENLSTTAATAVQLVQ